jgi:TATA-box binding protein (TBP) (component of TFIID and TFIIIB)
MHSLNINKIMNLDINSEWETYINELETDIKTVINDLERDITPNVTDIIGSVQETNNFVDKPKCSDLNISTQTKVAYLSQPIDIYNIFWEIPVISYSKPEPGIIKKQMKLVSNSREEFEENKKKLEGVEYCNEHIIKQIDNPTARRIKFKDERKITVGLSRKDIINSRGKVKNAFYNCFALCIRFVYNDVFKEMHVKVFNTGKLEIPGITNHDILGIIKEIVINILQPHISNTLSFNDCNGTGNVLINSNFTCGYTIDREKLQNILKGKKYNIETAYDPCSYPGVKCKYYYNNELLRSEQTGSMMRSDDILTMEQLSKSNKYTVVSFMIFRTGSVLIVGNCNEEELNHIYVFIRRILEEEYDELFVIGEPQVIKDKTLKIRKRKITINDEFFAKYISA